MLLFLFFCPPVGLLAMIQLLFKQLFISLPVQQDLLCVESVVPDLRDSERNKQKPIFKLL